MKIRITVHCVEKHVFIKEKNQKVLSITLFEGNLNKLTSVVNEVGKQLHAIRLTDKHGGMYIDSTIKAQKDELRNEIERILPTLKTGFEAVTVSGQTTLQARIEYVSGEATALVDEKALAAKLNILEKKYEEKTNTRSTGLYGRSRR